MTDSPALTGLAAARQMASLSPETQERFDRSVSQGWSEAEQVSQAFRAIGFAMSSKKRPISDANTKTLFQFTETLLTKGSPEVSNAVATDMLEAIWTSAHGGGFDMSTVDPYLGSEARRYLIAWDDFQKTVTPGLTRK